MPQRCEILGNKISARQLAEQAGIPVLPWSGGPVETEAEAHQHAARLEYPLMIKPAAGSGGLGIRRVSSPSELAGALKSARNEAQRIFGDPAVFLEQMLAAAHLIEAQVLADNYGTTWTIGIRDCTIQHHGQKLLEESSSAVLLPEQESVLRVAAEQLCQIAGYRGAGTVEFLYDPCRQGFCFLEFTPRLSAGHAVTEITTGADLVKLQLDVARGVHLEGGPPAIIGHAVGVHLCAQDPDDGFTPSPGRLELFRLAGGPGLRVDSGYEEGNIGPPAFETGLARIIAWGRDRQEALARLSRALTESAVVIRRGMSNKAFLLDLLNHSAFDANDIDNLSLDRLPARTAGQIRQHAEVALLLAAIEVYNAEQLVEQARFYASAARGRPVARMDSSLTTDLRYGGQVYRLTVSRPGPCYYQVTTEGQRIDVRVERLGPFQWRITCFGQRFRALSAIDEPDYYVEIDGVPHHMTHEGGGIVRAPTPAVVVSITVAPGDSVAAGDRLAVVEAMKMEMAITSPFAGSVTRVFASSNTQVDKGTPLLQIEPFARSDMPLDAKRVQFGYSRQPAELKQDDLQSRYRAVFEALGYQVLGHDIDADAARQLLAEQTATYRIIDPANQELLAGENEILSIFADICALFRRELDPAEANAPDVQVHSTEQDLLTYLRSRDIQRERLSISFLDKLRRLLIHYGVKSLDPSPELDESLLLIYKSHRRVNQHLAAIIAILERRLEHVDILVASTHAEMRTLLDRLIPATQGRYPAVNDLAREARFRYFERPIFEQARNKIYEEMRGHLAYLAKSPFASDREERIDTLVACPQPLQNLISRRFPASDDEMRLAMLETLTRRYYRIHRLEGFMCTTIDGQAFAQAVYYHSGERTVVVTTFCSYEDFAAAASGVARFVERFPVEDGVAIDFYAWCSHPLSEAGTTEQEIRTILDKTIPPSISRTCPRRIVAAVSAPGKGLGMTGTQHFTYHPGENGYEEERLYRGFHPMMGERLHIWRLANFQIERLPSAEDVYLFHGIARDNPKDVRLFALAEVRDMTPLRDEAGKIVHFPHLERMLMEALESIRLYQSHLPVHARLPWNRVLLYVWPPLSLQPEAFLEIMRELWPATSGLGLERIVLHAKIAEAGAAEPHDCMLHISSPGGRELVLRVGPPVETPITTLSEYWQKVVQLRRRGLVYPYELIEMLTLKHGAASTWLPPGDFSEYDLDEDNRLVPVDRPYGKNRAGIVVGVIRNYTSKYPEGMTRVILLGDPSRSLGSVAEPECRLISEALHLAARLRAPLEWFALSAGARISMDSGTENMDWVARTLRSIGEFTQAGGEINVIVNGINVGAQAYWNAAATMLMHTRGILIMTPNGAMVLTGKLSLDYSGSVSAEDNYGIGGYEHIMGPNGQAQYFAPDLATACQILMRHYDHTYVVPGERFPRRAATSDPATRDVRVFPYHSTGPEDSGLTCIGDLFSDEKNAGRKRAFDIRSVMSALIDTDSQPLERWHDMRDADTAVAWDAHIGGYPLAMLGIESHPIPRSGFVPGDGPEQWTAGTLFSMSAKKVARTINSASGNRPLVVIANLSGFDGSPESMRNFELEYGAEVGRAIANFQGPIVFCVISRYHGGAFVVFSKALNENMEVAAVKGSYASVIGGIPAAAVVFTHEVDLRTRADSRVKALQEQLLQSNGAQKAALQIRLKEVTAIVHSEKVGEIASEFDHIHTIDRAQRVRSIDYVIPPAALRPYLIEALERGIEREAQR